MRRNGNIRKARKHWQFHVRIRHYLQEKKYLRSGIKKHLINFESDYKMLKFFVNLGHLKIEWVLYA